MHVAGSKGQAKAASRDPTLRYVVEHLEEVFEAGKWCFLEYQHIINTVGANRLFITNMSAQDSKLLGPTFATTRASIADLHGKPGDAEESKRLFTVDPARVCFLDMRADLPLSPEDAGVFDYVVFGGVLGDHPPRDRCLHLRGHGYPLRHLGARQMTTDTAVLTVKLILEEGRPLSSLQFVDDPDVPTGLMDSTRLPFRYLVDPKHKDS